MIQFVAHHIPGAGLRDCYHYYDARYSFSDDSISCLHNIVAKRKMKKSKPELQKLKKKYGDVSKDLEKQKQYQKEMSELIEIRRLESTCWLLASINTNADFSAFVLCD